MVATLLVLSVTASNPYLDDGAALYNRMLYEEAAAKLQRAAEVTTSTTAERRKAHELLARTYVALGRSEDAARTFRTLLAADPLAPEPLNVSPTIRRMFLSAKEQLYPKGHVELRRLPSSGRKLTFEVLDPWSEVVSLELREVDAAGTEATTRLDPSPLVNASLAASTRRCAVVALAAQGVQLGSLAVETEAAPEPAITPPALVEAPAAHSRWPIWTGIAATAVFALAGGICSGVALSDSQMPAHFASDRRALDLSAQSFGITGTVFWVLTGLAAAASVVLVLAW